MQDLEGFTEADQELKRQFDKLKKDFPDEITSSMRNAYNKYHRLYRKSDVVRHHFAKECSQTYKNRNRDLVNAKKRKYYSENRSLVMQSNRDGMSKFMAKNPEYYNIRYWCNREEILRESALRYRERKLAHSHD